MCQTQKRLKGAYMGKRSSYAICFGWSSTGKEKPAAEVRVRVRRGVVAVDVASAAVAAVVQVAATTNGAHSVAGNMVRIAHLNPV